ncbi:hypothetical protein Slin15195_G108310 [Septoria linicola]|uniref:Uncharacterized protein n=1 Tax=Septoria linicola TaxID=215465 RepID=A0A9Q9EPB0_9PEZI|nr:hypothetical protein Slin15195_G108310 [Septoria linicola]
MPLLRSLDVYTPLWENMGFVIGSAMNAYFDSGAHVAILTPMPSLITLAVAMLATLAVLIFHHAKESTRSSFGRRFPSLKDPEDLANVADLCAACMNQDSLVLPCHLARCKDCQELTCVAKEGVTICSTCDTTLHEPDGSRLQCSILDRLLYAQTVMKVARCICGIGPLLLISTVGFKTLCPEANFGLNRTTINGVMASCAISLWIDATCWFTYRDPGTELAEFETGYARRLVFSIPVYMAAIALSMFHVIMSCVLSPDGGVEQAGAVSDFRLMAALMSMMPPDRLFQAVEKLSNWWCGEEMAGNGAESPVAEQALDAKV